MPGFTDFLSRIQTDYAFYLQFRKSPQEALAPYELASEEQAALTQSGPQLWANIGRLTPGAESLSPDVEGSAAAPPSPAFSWRIATTNIGRVHIPGPGSVDLEFQAAAELRRLEVQQAITEIRRASTLTARLSPVLNLIQHLR
jgi:hypothetical protein